MLSSKDFLKPSQYNLDTKNQLWCSVIADSHDSICGCNQPFAHLLASIFPPGHKDRNLTIDQILIRDYKELCLSGGAAAENGGGAAATKEKEDIKEENQEDFIKDEDLTELLAAAAEEDASTR